MSPFHNLKPERVVKAFKRAGWTVKRQKGSHIHMGKKNTHVILSIPVHKGKPVKKGLLLKLIRMAGLTVDEFLEFYNK